MRLTDATRWLLVTLTPYMESARQGQGQQTTIRPLPGGVSYKHLAFTPILPACASAIPLPLGTRRPAALCSRQTVLAWHNLSPVYIILWKPFGNEREQMRGPCQHYDSRGRPPAAGHAQDWQPTHHNHPWGDAAVHGSQVGLGKPARGGGDGRRQGAADLCQRQGGTCGSTGGTTSSRFGSGCWVGESCRTCLPPACRQLPAEEKHRSH